MAETMNPDPKDLGGEDWESWEEVLYGRPSRGGGGGKERKFGTGRRAKEKKEKLVVGFSREKRRQDLEAQLLDSFPKEEDDLLAYRSWVEDILEGKEAFSSEDAKITATLARGHGGQHVQKNLTAIEAVHLPTGLRAYNADERRQHINKERALGSLKEKVESLAAKWRSYEKESNGSSLALFEKLGPPPKP